MDYEKKYKEALERARAFQEKYGGDYAGYIFPELAESEDERIRKQCIKLLREAYSTKYEAFECIAWLEKQKEQKPAEWSEEDGMIIDNLIGFVTDYGDNCYTSIAKADVLNWLEKWKSANRDASFANKNANGWSEEDDQLIGFIFDLLNSLVWRKEWAMGKKECLDRLKSLPERFVLQPKQEWSEEDEEILDGIINTLDRLGYAEFCKSSREEDIEEERFYYKEIQCLKKLKSLHPQPHWKPSVEQMEMGLEEEIKRWWSREYMRNSEGLPVLGIVQGIARHFAKWQKEQMMKGAVEGEVSAKFSNRRLISLLSPMPEFKYGDKVRIIVLPKEA